MIFPLQRRPAWRSIRSCAFDGVSAQAVGTAAAGHLARPLTISFWFATAAPGTIQGVLGNYLANDDNGWRVLLGSQRNLQFLATDDGTLNPGHFIGHNTADLGVAAGAWHHAALVWEAATDQVRWHFDGARVSLENKALSGIHASNDPLRLGRIAGWYWNGHLDEVSLWSAALSEAAANALYHAGRPGNLAVHAAAADLVHWWRMGEGASFPAVPDRTGSAAALTLTNMTADDIVEVVP